MSSGTATAATNSPASQLDFQMEQVRSRSFDFLGYVWKIVLEASRGAATPEAAVAQSVGCALDWYGYENVAGQNYLPRIAQSRDRSSLLFLDPVKRIDGKVGLPDIPDPLWVPRAPTQEELQTTVPLQRAPMIAQHLYEEDEAGTPIGRARGQLTGTKYLVFGPVKQILVRPVDSEGKLLGDQCWILQCKGNPATGKEMELLIDQITGQAFFYEGSFQISIPG